MRTLAAALVAITLSLTLVGVSHAEPTRKHAAAPRVPASEPVGPCDFTHRLDLEIIDGVWHECMCLALTMGWDCGWVRLPEPAAASLRKRIRQHHAIRAYMPRAWVLA